jgi:hypothetical protein
MKVCSRCKCLKRICEFSSDRSRKDGRNVFCIPCRRAVGTAVRRKACSTPEGRAREVEAARRYQRKYPERHLRHYRKYSQRQRRKRLESLYGLTVTQAAGLARAQQHRCAICSTKLRSGNRRGIDHCHRTGTVRGVLCSQCNRGLGLFHDDVKALRRAVAYLQSDGVWSDVPLR